MSRYRIFAALASGEEFINNDIDMVIRQADKMSPRARVELRLRLLELRDWADQQAQRLAADDDEGGAT